LVIPRKHQSSDVAIVYDGVEQGSCPSLACWLPSFLPILSAHACDANEPPITPMRALMARPLPESTKLCCIYPARRKQPYTAVLPSLGPIWLRYSTATFVMLSVRADNSRLTKRRFLSLSRTLPSLSPRVKQGVHERLATTT